MISSKVKSKLPSSLSLNSQTIQSLKSKPNNVIHYQLIQETGTLSKIIQSPKHQIKYQGQQIKSIKSISFISQQNSTNNISSTPHINTIYRLRQKQDKLFRFISPKKIQKQWLKYASEISVPFQLNQRFTKRQNILVQTGYDKFYSLSGSTYTNSRVHLDILKRLQGYEIKSVFNNLFSISLSDHALNSLSIIFQYEVNLQFITLAFPNLLQSDKIRINTELLGQCCGQCRNLKFLKIDLSYQEISVSQAIQHVITPLRNCKKLKGLNLNLTGKYSDYYEQPRDQEFISSFTGISQIESLCLGLDYNINQINSKALEYLFKILSTNFTQLQMLKLSLASLKIGDESLIQYGEFLKQIQNLKYVSLRLQRINITDKGALLFSKQLQTMNNLKSLDLYMGSNSLSGNCVNKIKESLGACLNIKYLNIQTSGNSQNDVINFRITDIIQYGLFSIVVLLGFKWFIK